MLEKVTVVCSGILCAGKKTKCFSPKPFSKTLSLA